MRGYTKNMRTQVFIHGAFGAAKDLIPLTTQCKGVKVKLISLPFHGSEAGQAFRYQSLKEALKQKLQDEEDFSIFGYSMGGYLALDLASEGAIQPHSITTYGTRFFWTKELVQRIEGIMTPESLRMNLPEYAEELEAMHGDTWPVVIESTLKLMNDLIHYPLHLNKLNLIKAQTSLFIGDRDILTNLEETKSVSETIQSCGYKVIAGEHDIKKLQLSSLQIIAQHLSLQNA